jgi:hypothetical protein
MLQKEKEMNKVRSRWKKLSVGLYCTSRQAIEITWFHNYSTLNFLSIFLPQDKKGREVTLKDDRAESSQKDGKDAVNNKHAGKA